MKYQFNDGGRSKYFSGNNVGDCVTRSIAIATGRDYKEVYGELHKFLGYSPRNGIKYDDIKKSVAHFGGSWVRVMKIGSGCKVHLKEGEIPMTGTIICRLSGHLCCVKDGVLLDTYDSSRNGTRCVYGFWKF